MIVLNEKANYKIAIIASKYVVLFDKCRNQNGKKKEYNVKEFC